MQNADKRAEMICKRFDSLKADRSVFESHWQEVFEYVLPHKAEVTVKRTPGDKRNHEILDNTAIQANELLAGFLHGFLTNPSEKWFELTSGDYRLDEDDEVRRWLQDCENRMMNVILNSNFQTEVHEMYLDLGSVGTAPMSIEEDEAQVVRFTSRPISQCVIDENYRGEIDTIIRECTEMSLNDMVAQFGEDSLNSKMAEEFKKDPEKKYAVLHGILPREDFERAGVKPKKMLPVVSCYVVKEHKHVLRESGFEEFPWVVPRWSKLSSEKYGRSPGMVALPEAKLINKMAETIIKGAQKVVDPPLQLPSDGFILPLNTKPGGLNYRMSGTGDRDEIKPILNDARIDFGNDVMEGVRRRIRDAFYQNELTMSTELPQQTATEVDARMQQRNRFMGPLLGRQTVEFLRPMIDRVFSIMLRRKMFAEPPMKLSGRTIDVRYSSAIAQVQRANTAAAIQKALAASAQAITMDPQVADLFNGEEIVRENVRIYGAPQRILRDRDGIEQIRNARAQAQEQQAKLAQGQVDADIAQKQATAKAKLSSVG
jgi:hypothetical protein